MISFDTQAGESALIKRIVKRAKQQGLMWGTDKDLSMDLTACHANGTKLDLERLLHAPSDTFGHDINGIQNCLSRTTGKLTGLFSPRTSMPKCECGSDMDPHGDLYVCLSDDCDKVRDRANPATDPRCELQPE